MKYLEFGTEHPELMVILHGGGICYRAADIVHSDVLGEYIRDGAALGTFDFDALAPDIAHGTVGDDHLRNLPYRLQPDADARADRGERTVGDMHILHGTAAGLQAKVTLVSSTVVPGVTAYCIVGIQLFGNWRLVFGIGSNASGVPVRVKPSTAHQPPGQAARAVCSVQLCAVPGQSAGRAKPASNASRASVLVMVWRRICPSAQREISVTTCTPGSGAQTARRPFAVIDQLSGCPLPRYGRDTESSAPSPARPPQAFAGCAERIA